VGRRPRGYRLRYMSIGDLRVEGIWDVLGRRGVEGIYANLPVSTPAPEVRGVWIGGEQVYREVKPFDVYPGDVYRAVRESGYVVGYPNVSGHPEKYLDGVMEAEYARLRVFSSLVSDREWGLSIYIAYAPDIVLHAFYGVDGYGEYIYKCFEGMDRWLGRLLDRLEDRDILVLMSDHGHGYKRGYVNLLSLLSSLGLLGIRSPRGVRASWIRRVGLVRRLWWKLPRGLRSWVNRHILGRVILIDSPSRVAGSSIEWSSTKVFPSVDVGGLKIHRSDIFPRGVVDPGHAERLAEEVVEALRSVRDDSGPIFKDVYHVVSDDPLVPDIYLEPRDDLWFKSRPDAGLVIPNRPHEYLRSDWIEVAGDRASYHVREGFIHVYGDGVEPGEAGALRMVDVMPTLLHILGAPIPVGLDGRVVEAVLPREAINRDVRYERSLRRDLRARSRSLRRRLKR